MTMANHVPRDTGLIRTLNEDDVTFFLTDHDGALNPNPEGIVTRGLSARLTEEAVEAIKSALPLMLSPAHQAAITLIEEQVVTKVVKQKVRASALLSSTPESVKKAARYRACIDIQRDIDKNKSQYQQQLLQQLTVNINRLLASL